MRNLAILLLPFSLIYFLILKSIYFLYRIKFLKRFRPNCIVISVGNITFGGTGKTPIVELLAKYLQNKGKKVAVLIRGYGRDESLILKNKLDNIAVLVGRGRIKNSIEAVRDFESEVIILDDGFQHWRLERDFDIVVIDSTRPFGNGLLLPAGMLREPLSALKRSDVFFLTRTDQASEPTFKETLDRLKRIKPNALVIESIHRPLFFYRLNNPVERIFPDTLKQKEVALISSIGNPDAFQKTIESLGIFVKRHFRFVDHYWYKTKDISKIFDFCRIKKIPHIITTEKDSIKLSRISEPRALSPEPRGQGPDIFVLAIRVEILKNEQGLFDRLNRICSG